MTVVDHKTYVIAGDGCLMEGISHEAISLAGHLKLGKLIVLFDDNSISIDGPTSLAVSDDQLKRFEACGWAVAKADGHDPAAIRKALAAAQSSDRPVMIAMKTIIGFGAPKKQGTAGCAWIAAGAGGDRGGARELGWPHAPFEVPEAVLAAGGRPDARGKAAHDAWDKRAAKLSAAERGRLVEPIDAEAASSDHRGRR